MFAPGLSRFRTVDLPGAASHIRSRGGVECSAATLAMHGGRRRGCRAGGVRARCAPRSAANAQRGVAADRARRRGQHRDRRAGGGAAAQRVRGDGHAARGGRHRPAHAARAGGGEPRQRGCHAAPEGIRFAHVSPPLRSPAADSPSLPRPRPISVTSLAPLVAAVRAGVRGAGPGDRRRASRGAVRSGRRAADRDRAAVRDAACVVPRVRVHRLPALLRRIPRLDPAPRRSGRCGDRARRRTAERRPRRAPARRAARLRSRGTRPDRHRGRTPDRVGRPGHRREDLRGRCDGRLPRHARRRPLARSAGGPLDDDRREPAVLA